MKSSFICPKIFSKSIWFSVKINRTKNKISVALIYNQLSNSFTVMCCHCCASWGCPVGLTAGATIPVQPLSWRPSYHKITIIIYGWPTAQFTIWCLGEIYCKMLLEECEGGDGCHSTQAAKICFTPDVTVCDQTFPLGLIGTVPCTIPCLIGNKLERLGSAVLKDGGEK